MDSAIPSALTDRLGPDATDGLLRLLDQVQTDLREDVITACTDRFERRLVEQVSGVRVQMAQAEASIRQDMTRQAAELRTELHQGIAGLRTELHQGLAGLRTDLHQQIAGLSNELRHEIGAVSSRMAADRFELLKWAFLFWIGQVVAIGTLFGIIMRMSGRV